jgi:hypothetical protein
MTAAAGTVSAELLSAGTAFVELEFAESASAESVSYYWPEHLPPQLHHLLG